MARIIEGIKEVKTLRYEHGSAVEAGDVIVEEGIALIAVNDAGANVENVYAFSCRAAFPKDTGGAEGIDAPKKVFWSGTVATETSDSNTPLGIAIEDAGDDDAEVIVDMDPRVFLNDADNIGIADAGGFTAEDDVEGALQEVYQDLATAQAFLPVNLLSAVELNGDLLAAFADGVSTTPGLDVVESKGVGIRWNDAAEPDAIIAAVALPPDLNPDEDVVVHILAAKTGDTVEDATTFDVGAFFQAPDALYDADADAGGATDAMTGDAAAKTVQHVSRTIESDDVVGAPGILTLTLQPTDGTIGTDDVVVLGLWLEYTRKILDS